MADWKDSYEDNKEFFGQYLDSVSERRGAKDRAPSIVSPPVQFCPLCHSAFIEDGLLSEHIQRVHGTQHIYLRVNGGIIRDLGWAEQGISELKLVQIGFSGATVELSAPGFRKELSVSGSENLLPTLPASLEGELIVKVMPSAGSARQFIVYSRSLPEFRRDDLDSLILAVSEADLQPGRTPDIGRWRAMIDNLGVLENRYLNGFFEYTLAFQLERERQFRKAKYHFEEAFGLLLPFRTALAHSAQCVLGLRMNCFGVLARAPRASVVALSDHFFNDPFSSEWGAPFERDNDNPFVTHADEFTLRFVRVTADFYGSDRAAFAAGLEALAFHPAAQDKNNEDKLSLLKARAQRRNKQSIEACREYESIRYHPLFGSEAEQYLYGKSRD